VGEKKNAVFVRPTKPVEDLSDAEIDAMADAMYDKLTAPQSGRDERR